MLHAIINNADYYSRSIERVPDSHHIRILSGHSTGLSRIIEMPLIIEIRVIRLKSGREILLHKWRE